MKLTIDILRLFQDIVDFQSIKHVVPVVTSAVREATNGTGFLEPVFQETGLRFRYFQAKKKLDTLLKRSSQHASPPLSFSF